MTPDQMNSPFFLKTLLYFNLVLTDYFCCFSVEHLEREREGGRQREREMERERGERQRERDRKREGGEKERER